MKAILLLALALLAGCQTPPADRRLEPRSCPVHGLTLPEDTVAIQYGLPAFVAEYEEARKAQFPESHVHVLGGCVIEPTSPQRARVRYCPECRVARQRWLDEHPQSRQMAGP